MTPLRMVRLLVLTAVLAALGLIFAIPAFADGFIIPEPPPGHDTTWRDVPLSVRYHRVDVQITGQVATTHVDQVFVNNSDQTVEGTYIFPLPDDAAVNSFDMWVDGRKLEGRLLSREQARAIYEDIVRRQRDPALLEYVGRGAFQASIFPIPPRGERRVELTYAQVLPKVEGLVRYRYPLSTEKFSARPLDEVAITVHISGKLPLRAIYSPTHVVDVARKGEREATVSYEESNVLPDRDFELFYSDSSEDIAVDLLTYKPYDDDGFFLLLLTPPLETNGDEIAAKDVMLVLDVSGSMDGEKLIQAKAAADYVLDQLGPRDRFNIVAFSTAARMLAEAPIPSNRKADGHAFIRKLAARGSTDINRALLEALAGADSQRPTVVIFLTDGLPTAGEIDPDRIVANVAANAPKSVRLFAFGVGYDVDTMLLDQLSSGQRGVSDYVQPGQKIDEQVSGFYAKISRPVLVDVGLHFAGVQVEDLYPYPMPDLFIGNQLVIAGRYRDGAASDLTVTGFVDGKAQTLSYHVQFAKRGGDEFIAPLWAQRKIGYLLAQLRLHGTNQEMIDEIVALSTRYGIVTPYTSFLVEEPALALTEGGRDQLARSLATPGSGIGGGAAALAPEARSGANAVERAAAEKALSSSEQAAAPAVAQVRLVGDKAFVSQNGVWVDTTYDASQMQAEKVAFASERYFRLLSEHPEIGRFLALGDRVTIVILGKAYTITR